jgi:hypothetical protein
MAKILLICFLLFWLAVIGGKSQPLKIQTPMVQSIILAAEQANADLLCGLRQELTMRPKSEQTNTLIEYLDKIASDKFGFTPSLCKKVAESDMPKNMFPYEDDTIEKALKDIDELLSHDSKSENPLNDVLVDASGDGDLSNNFDCDNCHESSQTQIMDTFIEDQTRTERINFSIDLGIGLVVALFVCILIIYFIISKCCCLNSPCQRPVFSNLRRPQLCA